MKVVCLLPLLAACTTGRAEFSASFSSFTRGWSIPAYSPRGAVGDNEPEHAAALVVPLKDRLSQVYRISGGEGTLSVRPQRKVTVYAAAWALRGSFELGRRWSAYVQAGSRLAWIESLRRGVVDFGPEVAVGLRRQLTTRLSIAVEAGAWWSMLDRLPDHMHPRLGLVFAVDF